MRLKRLVAATGNSGKLREIQAILAPLAIECVPQSELGIGDADEPHFTFVENALAKARHASRASGLPALADDSGICVAALGGEPGVHSARFAGEPKSDARNNEKLIELLRAHTDRRAHYYCVMVLMRSAEDPEPIIADAAWHGEIILEAHGSGGFGYDPYFYLPELNLTAAALPAEHKNRVSHRGKALAGLVEQLRGS
jgi:XTP/dITP diphosphohydrolase